jgi:hypothetical protein
MSTNQSTHWATAQVIRTAYSTHRAKTVPSKPRVARKAACRGAATRKALRDEAR